MVERRPDILVLVLDAVRSLDVFSPLNGDIALPFLRRFGKTSVVFPKAVAPAAWTVPSVASLMTGLYPWNHGVSVLGSSFLNSSVPTLAGTLREHGYATILLSANGVISPRTNLSSGFERAYWAAWWEQFLRLPRATPAGLPTKTPSSEQRLIRGRKHGFRTLLRRGMRLGLRYPQILQAGNLIAQRLKTPGSPSSLAICPWIEPVLSSFLAGTTVETPVFAFLHLNDAHEPYYSQPGSLPGGSEEKLQMSRQDYMRVIEGRWSPSDRELETLHRLYVNMLRVLDARIQGIIEHFLEVRGAENSFVVVTADHGQALGEGGWLFHMASPDEAVLRVPLIVRFPNSQISGVARGWASLVDVFPTILATAEVPTAGETDGVPLMKLLDADRETPVWALGDGLPWRHLEGIVFAPGERPGKGLPDRKWIASYEGAGKSLYDLRRRMFTYSRVDFPPAMAGASDGSEEGPSPTVQNQVIVLARKFREQAPSSDESETLRRLKSWGYGI
ncbi:MAG: sulfatase-like hydrolase/transferase [Thermoplasmata archaeon]|nr:sulfatase-like hydrolase/transferase [Thermoplasmata archaeon]